MNTGHGQKLKVLCVDDSALMRSLLSEIVNSHADMTMVAAAPDPLVARALIKRHNPDVLTLDVEMPRMDGLDFLEKLMRLRPMPVLMISALTERGSEATLRALELGAVDFLAKPRLDIRDGMLEYRRLIGDKIRAAARARLRPCAGSGRRRALQMPLSSSEKLLIVGASTGGPQALRELLAPMPADAPGILITQHMPAGFTAALARRLDASCHIRVKEAEHDERVLPGHAYIAPGGVMHLRLARSGANYMVALAAGEPVNRHRPSVDVLFASAATNAGRNAIGIVLTGMGKDGARGLLKMRGAGAWTLAQDEATSVVFGMPREAIALGAVQQIVPIERMCEQVLAHLDGGSRRGLRV